MSENKMDTEPGGESNQYESIRTVTEPAEKQSGQLGGGLPNTSEDTSGVSADRGQQTADNMRYGQNVSESGMGGMTTTSSGDAQQGGYGGAEAQDTELKNTRREQGMGPGNDVGA